MSYKKYSSTDFSSVKKKKTKKSLKKGLKKNLKVDFERTESYVDEVEEFPAFENNNQNGPKNLDQYDSFVSNLNHTKTKSSRPRK
jgi:hypothetical protein